MAKEKSRSCGAVIYRVPDTGPREYLLVKGTNNEWGFSKGNVELGENDHQAAKREVKEEVDLDIDLVDGFKETYRYKLRLKKFGVFKKTLIKEVVIFLSEVEGNPKINKQDQEILEAQWFEFREALDVINFKERKRILKLAENFLGNTML